MAATPTTSVSPTGLITWKDTDLDATVVAIKASSAVISLIDVDNSNNGAATYLCIWNSTATITIGTTVPDLVIIVPASTHISLPIPAGLTLGTGVQVACKTTGGTSGSTGPTSDVPVTIIYT